MRPASRKLRLFVFFCSFLCYCSHEKKTKKEDVLVDDKVVLSVGDIDLTAYEFQKNYTAFKQTFTSQHNRPPSKAESDQWIQGYIAKAYFLADASAKGYYKREDIERTVENMESIILFQPNGLLEQELFASLTPGVIKSEVEKSKRQIHLQYLKFPDRNTADRILAETGGMEWEAVLNMSVKAGAISGRDKYQWPFTSLWSESKSIADINKGQTSSLLKISNDYYLVHVEDISYLPKPALDENQMEVKLRQDIQKKYYDRIQQQAHLTIKEEGLFKMAGRIDPSKPLSTLETKEFSDILKKSLASYRLLNGQEKQISVEEFIIYYNELPVRTLIANSNSIRDYLYTMAYSTYARKDAERFGLTKEPKFILDKKNFKNDLVYRKYEENLLTDTLPVSDIEVARVYESMKAKLTMPTQIVYSMFSFKNRDDAFYSKMKLQMYKNADTTTLKGVLSSKRHFKINFESKAIPDTLKKTLFSLRLRQVSYPVNVTDSFVLMVKEGESGSRILSLEEARPFLIKEMRNGKLLSNKQAKLVQLNKVYRKKDNIDYSAYK